MDKIHLAGTGGGNLSEGLKLGGSEKRAGSGGVVKVFAWVESEASPDRRWFIGSYKQNELDGAWRLGRGQYERMHREKKGK